MTLKIILDEDVHYGLAAALRKRGFNVIHVQDIKRKGRTDKEQLDFAIKNKSCIFSYNVKDFVILHNEYAKNKIGHWGIIVSKQLSFNESLHRLLPKLQKFTKESMRNRLEFL